MHFNALDVAKNTVCSDISRSFRYFMHASDAACACLSPQGEFCAKAAG